MPVFKILKNPDIAYFSALILNFSKLKKICSVCIHVTCSAAQFSPAVSRTHASLLSAIRKPLWYVILPAAPGAAVGLSEHAPP